MDVFLIIWPGSTAFDKQSAPDPYYTSAQFKGCAVIELEEFSFGAETPVAVSQAGTGVAKLVLGELTVKKHVDKYTPALFMTMAMGQHYPVAQIYLRAVGATTPEKPSIGFEIQQVFVSDMEWSGSSGERATESVTFVYGAAVVGFRAKNPDGTLAAPIKEGWNAVTNQETMDVGGRLLA